MRLAAAPLALWLCLQGFTGGHASVGYIVVLRHDVAADSVIERTEAAVERRYRHALSGFAVRLSAEDATSLGALRRHPDVAFVAEDRVLELHGQVFQPGMERVRADRNKLTRINGIDDVSLDVDIAVMDSGIDAAHPDLNVHRSVSFVPGDPSPTDLHGHGTHVAGIAAAIDDDRGVHGVAPGARLWSIKVVGEQGLASLSDVLSGLDYVAANAERIDVLNISLGGSGIGDDGQCGATSGDPLHQAICRIVDAGVVVVASAGNHVPSGRDASLVSPAAYDEVITVSAVIETDGLGPGAGQGAFTAYGPDNAFARSFSNYGWDVDLGAPGVDVISTWPGGGYAKQSGTSMAAGFVAGAAAVWIARHGKPHNRDEVLRVRDELVRLAFPQFGPDEGFSDDRETYAEPLLNVAALDPGVFDPVEAQLSTDRAVYEVGQDSQAVITVQLKDEHGLPLGGIPSNGFSAYLSGQQVPVRFHEGGQGRYELTLDIESLQPGDHDFTALIKNVSGFERSAGCRIVIRHPTPRVVIRSLSFFWPVMHDESYFDSNPLHATLVDEKGAPLVVSPESFETTFSGGGPELSWSFPDPGFLTGVHTGITYGAYRTAVENIHSLPLGRYHANVAVRHAGLADAATASFDMAHNEPTLTATLNSNLSRFDFTQTIPPPALNLRLEVKNEWSTGVGGLLYLMTDPLSLTVDGEPVPEAIFTEEVLIAGTYRVHDVDLADLAHGAHRLRVRVRDNRGLEALSNPITIDVVRQADPPCADAQADDCDDCAAACTWLARVQVSSDPADDPDYFTIQDAVDEAPITPLGVQIEILPGAGPYVENVVVDRSLSVRFVGRDLGAGPPVIQASGPGASVFELRSSGDHPMVLRNLVLRGQAGGAGQRGLLVDGAAATKLTDLRFEELSRGIDLRGGDHRARRVRMDASVQTGLVVEDAALVLRASELRRTAQAVRLLGLDAQVDLEQVLLVGRGSGEGIAKESALSRLALRHATLVDWAVALDGALEGTAIAHAILWGTQSAPSGLVCADVAWSDIQHLSCGGTNRSVDPRFLNPAGGDYRLQATSPLLDHGPHPGEFGGVPCEDLDGGPRLVDHDGEGLAQVDPGAYERRNDGLTPRAVQGLAWTTRTRLTWSPAPAALEYHLYRGPLGDLGYSMFGRCEDGLDPLRSDTILDDTAVPPSGEGFFYQVTAEDLSDHESSLGLGSCAERSNYGACP